MVVSDKVVYVYQGSHDVYAKLLEFQTLIDDAIKKIPEEFRSVAQISITTHSCGCYNDYESCLEIFYTCPKTEEEIKKEKRKDRAWELERIKVLEKELMELKSKPRSKKT
jgi:aspartate/tyrosine/aromatic aminotransferase